MAWKFHQEAPIYLQIMEEIKRYVAQGYWEPGDRVPSVRELAIEGGVNPNTMQKALSELEREGILVSERTSGRFVAYPSEEREDLRSTLSNKFVESFVTNMRSLGYDDREIQNLLAGYLGAGENASYEQQMVI